MTKQQRTGSVVGAATAGLGLLTNAFDQAKIADTSGIESNISQQRNAIVGAMNNDALMSEWSAMTNLEAIKAKDLRGSNAGIGMLNGAVSGASGGAQFGPWGAAIGAGVGLLSSSIGSMIGANKARKKANELNADIATANMTRNNAFVNKANAIDKMNDLNLMANFAAYGGNLFDGGGGTLDNFINSKAYNSIPATALKILDPTGILSYGDVYRAWTDDKFDYNDILEPIGALPIIGKVTKIAKLGKFADIEKAQKIIGATKYSDYIKSGGRKLKRSFSTTNPYSGREIQEASRIIRNNQNLVNAQYGVRGLSSIDDIIDATNSVKSFAENSQKAMGGNLFSNEGDFTNGVTFIGNGGTHEENPLQGVPMGMDQEGVPNLVEEGEVKFNDYIFSDRIIADAKILKQTGLGDKFKKRSYADIAKNLQKESSERPNDPISKRGLEEAMSKLTMAQENQKMIEEQSNMKKNMFRKGGKMLLSEQNPSFFNFGQAFPQTVFTSRMPSVTSKYPAAPVIAPMPKSAYAPLDFGLEVNKLNTLQSNNLSKIANGVGGSGRRTNLDFDASMLRYAPVLGSALSVAGDLLGNNKPDYTNANMIAKANRPISFAPIGDYMDYNPLDRDYYLNKLNQSASATRDAIVNNSGGNRATATAGLLAADYNAQNKVGDLIRMAEEYNAAQKLKATEFNRGTNMYNSEMNFKADAENKQSDLMTARMVALMREDERNRSAMARSTNLTNLFDNLGEVGREEASRNMITSNPALYYTIKNDGNIEYKLPPGITPAEEAAVKAYAEQDKKSRGLAKGGKLKTKKTFNYGW